MGELGTRRRVITSCPTKLSRALHHNTHCAAQLSMAKTNEFVDLEPVPSAACDGPTDAAQTKADRCVCITLIAVCVVLLITSVVIFAVLHDDITDLLSADHEDGPDTVCLWFIAGLAVWIAMFVPYSLWIVPCVYYLRAWPGLFVVSVNILVGQTGIFLFGRLLQNTTRVGARLQAIAPERTQLIVSVRRVFKTKGYQLCFLTMWGPTSTPMLVWVIGLLTEAEFLTFTISAGIANLIVFAPLCVLGLLADNLGDAFSHGDGISIAILCFSILIFAAGMWDGGYVARREVEKMAVGQSASNVQAPTTKPNEAI